MISCSADVGASLPFATAALRRCASQKSELGAPGPHNPLRPRCGRIVDRKLLIFSDILAGRPLQESVRLAECNRAARGRPVPLQSCGLRAPISRRLVRSSFVGFRLAHLTEHGKCKGLDLLDNLAERINQRVLADLLYKRVPLNSVLVGEARGEGFDFLGRHSCLPRCPQGR